MCSSPRRSMRSSRADACVGILSPGHAHHRQQAKVSARNKVKEGTPALSSDRPGRTSPPASVWPTLGACSPARQLSDRKAYPIGRPNAVARSAAVQPFRMHTAWLTRVSSLVIA